MSKWDELLVKLNIFLKDKKRILLNPNEIDVILSVFDDLDYKRFELIEEYYDLKIKYDEVVQEYDINVREFNQMLLEIKELKLLIHILQYYFEEYHPVSFDTYLSSQCDDNEQYLVNKYFDLKIDREVNEI